MYDSSYMNKNRGQIFIKIKVLNYFKALATLTVYLFIRV